MKNLFQNVGVVILAAGKSKRMKSKINKLLTPFDGKPLIQRVYDACRENPFEKIILVIGPDSPEIPQLLDHSATFAIQHEQLGTGHALMQARPHIDATLEHIALVVGDHPFISGDALKFLVTEHKKHRAATSLLTVTYDNPPGYGRIVRDQVGRILKIVEQKDATPEEAQIKEVNISTYCFHVPTVLPLLGELQSDNAQHEYYLTDIIEMLLQRGHRVQAIPYPDNTVGLGINNRLELARALQVAREKHLEKLMISGVTILDPNSTYIDSTVTIGMDTMIYPYTFIEAGTIIGTDCRIGPQTKITNSQISDGVSLQFAVIENSQIVSGSQVPAFSHIIENRMTPKP